MHHTSLQYEHNCNISCNISNEITCHKQEYNDYEFLVMLKS